MEISHLKCFVVLAEQLSFSNAAHALYMEPSTLSKVIFKLEQEMGVRLFERTNRKVRLTPAGEMLLNDAKEITEIYDHCLIKARAAAQGSLGNLNICYCGDIEYSLLPRTTRSFLAEYPDVTIQLFRYSWRQIYNFSNFRQMDLGVTLSFGVPGFSQFEHCTICEDPFAAVLPFDHPLANRESLTINELTNEQFIFANGEMSLGTYYHTLDCIFPKGFRPSIVSEDRDAESVNLKIASGFGIGIATTLACRHEPMLRYIPLSDVPPAQLIAMWLPDNINPLVDRYINALKLECKKLGLIKNTVGYPDP